VWQRLTWVALLGCSCGRYRFDALDDAARDVAVDDVAIDAQIDPSLRLWLKMDDEISDRVATDASGYGHHGRCPPTDQCPSQTMGYRGGGLTSFSTVAPGLQIDDPIDELHLTTPFTLAAWVNFAAAGTISAVFEKQLGASNADSYELEMDATGTLNCEIEGAAVGTAVDVTAFPLNAWTHIACTHDGQQLRLYRDGVSVSASGAAFAITYDAGPLIIGSDRTGGAPVNHFNGVLDDVRIYARALDASELAAVMAGD